MSETSSTSTHKGYTMKSPISWAILGFIIILSFIWVILYSFRPSFVRKIERGEVRPADDAPADPARTFVAALIGSLLVVVILWMFRACK